MLDSLRANHLHAALKSVPRAINFRLFNLNENSGTITIQKCNMKKLLVKDVLSDMVRLGTTRYYVICKCYIIIINMYTVPDQHRYFSYSNSNFDTWVSYLWVKKNLKWKCWLSFFLRIFHIEATNLLDYLNC